jgi:hypothetical protein
VRSDFKNCHLQRPAVGCGDRRRTRRHHCGLASRTAPERRGRVK